MKYSYINVKTSPFFLVENLLYYSIAPADLIGFIVSGLHQEKYGTKKNISDKTEVVMYFVYSFVVLNFSTSF